ncbi:unnamed protein product [Brachionus calyciflorus]|uniref:Uncharacterized protein n=1 Tax=Brachionus calyciflorus TaxID=104777 RepID=A0A814EEG9_9BILA|nr:unnamed protein product [Brachionus calyciflorus]
MSKRFRFRSLYRSCSRRNQESVSPCNTKHGQIQSKTNANCCNQQSRALSCGPGVVKNTLNSKNQSQSSLQPGKTITNNFKLFNNVKVSFV